MPIHDLGYRTWQGPLVPQIGRFWVIAQTGVRMAWRNLWLRRMLYFSLIPALWIAALLFAYEQAQGAGKTILPQLQDLPFTENRHRVWACLLYLFFRYPQAFALLLIVGQVAPSLVAQDVRTKAFLLYFSRPLARFEYVLGKMAVVAFYLVLISALPGLVLYVLAVLLSPDLKVVLSTWDLPLRVLAASAVLIIPTTAVSLALSSLTSQTRYATFAWFAFWIVGAATYRVLHVNLLTSPHPERWNLLSMYDWLGTIEYWVFGLKDELAGLLPRVNAMGTTGFFPAPTEVLVWPAVVEMVVITLVALAVLFRRVSSPMRV
jgi:ABC-2 type transport system permease protein